MSRLFNFQFSDAVANNVANALIANSDTYGNEILEMVEKSKSSEKGVDSFKDALVNYFKENKSDCGEWHLWLNGVSYNNLECKQVNDNIFIFTAF